MKKTLKRMFSLVLAIVFIIPGTVVQAATYSDVGTGHWAYEYINKLSNDKIIEGYPEGVYRPDKEVAYLEVLKLLKGVMNPSNDEMTKARSEYSTVAKNAGVPDWAVDSVCIALYKNVITTATLEEAKKEQLISNNPTKVPNRNTIAVYFGRALGLVESTDYSVLKHKDASSIPESTKKYLAPLVTAKIFDETGSDGNFEGTRGIRRAEMAKITYLSNDYMKSEGEQKKVTGKVIMASTAANVRTIIIESGTVKTTYHVDDSTTYTLNGKTALFADVKEEQEITLYYVAKSNVESGRLAKKVELKGSALNAIGYVQSIDTNNNTIRINYTDNATNVNSNSSSRFNTDRTGEFKVATNAKISVYDSSKYLRDIKVDDMVEFNSTGTEITEIKVYPQSMSITGTVVSTKSTSSYNNYNNNYNYNYNDTQGEVVLRLSGKNYTFYLENNNNVRLSDFVTNQSTTVTLNYKVIKNVGSLAEDKGIRYGYIQRVEANGNQPVSIQFLNVLSQNYTGNVTVNYLERLELDRNAVVYRNEETLGGVPIANGGLNGLDSRTNLVKLKMGNNKITEIKVLHEDFKPVYFRGSISQIILDPFIQQSAALRINVMDSQDLILKHNEVVNIKVDNYVPNSYQGMITVRGIMNVDRRDNNGERIIEEALITFN